VPSLQIPAKLQPLLKPKKFKVVYGGRGSAKSMTVADLLLMKCQTEGAKASGMREMMNSIDDSVHALFEEEINRLELDGFSIGRNHIEIETGGLITYKGLARNPESVKSMHGFKYFWVEEAATLSKRSLDLLIPTLRKEDAELWLTFNPESSADPVYQEFIKPFEEELERDGYYEDELHIIIKANYCDNPFFPDNLEKLRLKHKETKSRAEYDHIWLGHTNDQVDNSIIKPEWFDAAIDAHKLEHLKAVFKPKGVKIASHDPSDTGNDSKGYALRHGSIIQKVLEKTTGEVDEGCDWALANAIRDRADWFVWDGDGMGTGLKRQVSDSLSGKRCQYHMFRGSLSGKGQDQAEAVYMRSEEESKEEQKTYSDTFKNNRAQYYMEMSRRFYNTYRCVVKGDYVAPEDMLSLDSEGIENLQGLRSEVCRIPLKENNTGLYQIMTKVEMKALGIKSPNMSDSIMMSLWGPKAKPRWGKLNYTEVTVA
jgi:phage terminase large subunit